jgi:hypothetical protein
LVSINRLTALHLRDDSTRFCHADHNRLRRRLERNTAALGIAFEDPGVRYSLVYCRSEDQRVALESCRTAHFASRPGRPLHLAPATRAAEIMLLPGEDPVRWKNQPRSGGRQMIAG